HLRVEGEPANPVIRLDQGPPENFCRPAVDPMLRSIVEVWGGRALAVILTGMGHDGQKGCAALVEAGGTVVAQDEATSVVWGMPGAVARAGLCSAVLPLGEIAAWVQRQTMRRAA
ncbi:MAG TPA: chemotaxis protein CheB, partial [Thalassobaculum sp.]